MDYPQAKQMLKRLRSEISMLQNEVAVLAPKAEAYDVLLKLVNKFAPGVYQAREDVLYTIDRELEKIQKEIDSMPQKAGIKEPEDPLFD